MVMFDHTDITIYLLSLPCHLVPINAAPPSLCASEVSTLARHNYSRFFKKNGFFAFSLLYHYQLYYPQYYATYSIEAYIWQ